MKIEEKRCDLHIHTTYSDGSATVEQVLTYAERKGLPYIAISDHDTLAGTRRGDQLIRKGNYHVPLITAVEMSTTDEETKRPVHILCYGPKDPEALQEMLNITLSSRREQKLVMMRKIQAIYPDYYMEDTLELSQASCSIYESHIMQAFCNMGYTNVAIGDLMTKLISKNGSCYVPSTYLGTMEVLYKVKEMGGIAVIAHPEQFDSIGLVHRATKAELIQGVECYHPRNGVEMTRELLEYAKKKGLLITGGSDFHGQYAKRPYPMGSYGCSQEEAQRLVEAIDKL